MEEHHDLPYRVLSFAVRSNSSIDCVPTFRNLQRWGKKVSAKCKLCGNKQTLQHILNGCKTMLDQGRFTWRHDNILHLLYKVMSDAFGDSYTVFADLEGVGHSTIPQNVIPTSQRPDIVVLSESQKEIIIVELSVPFETNIESRHTHKCNKYAPLVNDIVDQGYKCDLICLEVGSRGYLSKENKMRLKTSYSIFCAKDEPTWVNAGILKILNNL